MVHNSTHNSLQAQLSLRH